MFSLIYSPWDNLRLHCYNFFFNRTALSCEAIPFRVSDDQGMSIFPRFSLFHSSDCFLPCFLKSFSCLAQVLSPPTGDYSSPMGHSPLLSVSYIHLISLIFLLGWNQVPSCHFAHCFLYFLGDEIVSEAHQRYIRWSALGWITLPADAQLIDASPGWSVFPGCRVLNIWPIVFTHAFGFIPILWQHFSLSSVLNKLLSMVLPSS